MLTQTGGIQAAPENTDKPQAPKSEKAQAAPTKSESTVEEPAASPSVEDAPAVTEQLRKEETPASPEKTEEE